MKSGFRGVPDNEATSIDPHSCELFIEDFSDRCPEIWWCPILLEDVSVRYLWHSIVQGARHMSLFFMEEEWSG
jgi:hypothetical protein